MPHDDEVGYKKPPKRTRFQKGRSGNPKGRPKQQQATNPIQVLSAMLEERVTIKENGKLRSITKIEAYYARLLNGFLSGDIKYSAALQREVAKVIAYKAEKGDVSGYATVYHIDSVCACLVDGTKASVDRLVKSYHDGTLSQYQCTKEYPRRLPIKELPVPSAKEALDNPTQIEGLVLAKPKPEDFL